LTRKRRSSTVDHMTKMARTKREQSQEPAVGYGAGVTGRKFDRKTNGWFN
jgi:hypothetical protein